jgi:hypothetical protein
MNLIRIKIDRERAYDPGLAELKIFGSQETGSFFLKRLMNQNNKRNKKRATFANHEKGFSENAELKMPIRSAIKLMIKANSNAYLNQFSSMLNLSS